MAKGEKRKRRTMRDVLRYTMRGEHQDTVRAKYDDWRRAQGIPERCDIPECRFHTGPLEWNGKALRMDLDHIEGNRTYNRPDKLRLLCPNCHSQQPTRGGANRDRFVRSEGGFGERRADGTIDYTLPAETGMFAMKSAESTGRR